MIKNKFNRVYLVLSFLLLFVSCKLQENRRFIRGSFGFIWLDSGGHSKYIKNKDGKVYPFEFSDNSNQKYISAFNNLRKEIFCFNSLGRTIFLQGTYDFINERFCLDSWYIEVPYLYGNYSSFSDTTDGSVILKYSLSEQDFNSKVLIPIDKLIFTENFKAYVELKPQNRLRKYTYLIFENLNICIEDKVKKINQLNKFDYLIHYRLKKGDVLLFENGIEIKVTSDLKLQLNDMILDSRNNYTVFNKEGKVVYTMWPY